ncbi:MAG TPA: efflux RND transporter periplasmic adaptor subunit [Gemmatimonadales bacterium]|nr:efflux RND transporter periplasmic adaptor subunit [Gemmatimonadales bacterium]
MSRALARLALLAALAAACHRGEGDAARAAELATVVGATTAPATRRAVPQVVRAIGTVVPRPGRFAELAAPAATRVAGIFVAPGQRVTAGDSLVAFERAPFDAAAKSAEAALESAQRAYARAVRLAQAGILPQKDADQAAADLAQAQAAAVTARRAQQLATLRAPLSGVVTRMSAVLGASVDPSQPLVAVADPTALDLTFNVTPEEAGRIHGGDPVTITAGEGGERAALGEGSVIAVGAAIDSIARAVPVRARLVAPRRPLRIGEAVFGEIVTALHAAAVTVPIEALVPVGDGYQVFVVDSGGIAHARPVTVGARTEAFAEIVHGLEAGEIVVTRGAYGVQDSAKIVAAPE